MSEEKYELNLDDESQPSELQDINEVRETLSDDEKEILNDLENISAKCIDKGMTCFLVTKFPSQTEPSAAWYFGSTPQEAHSNFINDYAAVLLHMTSKFTLTKIVASNPQTGDPVYEVAPDMSAPSDAE